MAERATRGYSRGVTSTCRYAIHSFSATSLCRTLTEHLSAQPEMAELIAARPPVNSNSKKSAKAYAKTYLPPAPLVPAKILDAIVAYVQRMPGRKKRELVERAGRYWSLKREARRGAPLLKRLHLEVRGALSNSLTPG